MPLRQLTWTETWRVLAYTLAIALAFVGLGRLQLALFTAPGTQALLQHIGALDADPAARLKDEAARIAAASRDAMRRLPAGHRMATLRLGYELGYASQLVGVRALSAPDKRAFAQSQAEPHRALAQQLAAQLDLGEVQPLAADSLRAFVELGTRYEADENGLAARIEQRLSPWHRHAYLLGTQLGGESARIEDSGGAFSLPPASLILRHAALCGLPPALWQPLAAQPESESPEQVVQRYRRALQALADELKRQDAAGAAPGGG